MAIIWHMKNLVEIAKRRQANKFDCNICFSGARGNGKSTGLFKFFLKFDNFKPWTDIVYSRKEVMSLLESRKFGCIFDDEAIRSAYKRNFQDADQKVLIQMLNMYRDNFNVYGLAVPSFYSLDKDLRSLIKIHIQVIRRGLAIVHLPRSGSLYSDDVWDIAYNKKIEESWAKKMVNNPNYRPKYEKLTTFRGYLVYGDLKKKQREIYEKIKVTKRKKVYEEEMKSDKSDGAGNTESQMYNNLYEKLLKFEVTKDLIENISQLNNVKYSNIRNIMNKKLKDENQGQSLSYYLNEAEKRSKDIKIKTKTGRLLIPQV